MATNPFAVDWKDRATTIAYAEMLGRGMTVYKNPQRNNYNICHTSNIQRLGIKADWIVFQTP